jgi:transposase
MSTSLLYHAFGIRGYRHKRTEYFAGAVLVYIMQEVEHHCCSACESKNVLRRGKVERVFRGVPIGRKDVLITLEVPRLECRDCGVIRQAKIGFADPKVRYTRSFARYALDLSRHMTIQDVAEHLNASWDVIKEIQRDHLQRRFSRPKLKHLEQIAIDEISIAKGHRYLTVVLDLVSGAVVFVGDGKGADALRPFWRRVRGAGARIKAVAIDMSAAYIEAVTKNLPHARIVFDHFHIIKLYNEKLSELRRQLYNTLTDKLQKQVLKGTRWLLLKNPENLDDEKQERQRLQEALDLNQPLFTAYYMKEQLRELWDLPDKKTARAHLKSWIAQAEASGIGMLKKFAKTLALHREGILAYYDHAISTGPLEGTNNKIKTMKRQAYGFRDHEFLKLKILGIHETKYALVG